MILYPLHFMNNFLYNSSNFLLFYYSIYYFYQMLIFFTILWSLLYFATFKDQKWFLKGLGDLFKVMHE